MLTKLDMACAQIIGFKFGKWGRDNIIPMIESMGLTKDEWEKIKSDYAIDRVLDEDDIDEIEVYFNKDSQNDG